MMLRCCEYWAISSSRLAISKSAKSKPGATVQPTNANVSGWRKEEPNQRPAGTTAWKCSPDAWSLLPRRSC
jgi:hypothetical protein